MKRILSLVLCAMMLLGALAGCGSEAAPENSAAAPSEETASGENADELRNAFLSKANEVVVNEDSVTFKDSHGDGTEEITIMKNPAKPVSLYASFTTLWYEAGGRLAGTIGGDSAKTLYTESIGRDITEDEGVAVLAETSSGKNWDVESIVAFRPDLIICSTAMNGFATIAGPAEAANIPVIAMEYNDFADYLKWFKVFCNLNGQPELWDSVAMKTLDSVIEVISSCPDENNPKVFSMLSGSKSLKANTANTVLGGMIEELKGINIVDQWDNPEGAERLEISLETIVAADPDLILVQCGIGEDEAEAMVQKIYGENTVWQSLRAVKEGKVFYLPKALFHQKPNSRFAEAYEMLAGILYPAQ